LVEGLRPDARQALEGVADAETATSCLVLAGDAPSANTFRPKARNASSAAGTRARRAAATFRVMAG
jgi:hypothetical protein